MSDIVKGETVIATATGGAWRVRADERGRRREEWVKEGDELEVTAAGSKTYLNVRAPGTDNPVFRWPRAAVGRVRQVGVVPDGGISLDHPGLAWLWEDASRLAERFQFCSEFDRLADALGAPGREREFRVPMVSEDGIRITATVTARSRSLAERKIHDRISATSPLALTAGES